MKSLLSFLTLTATYLSIPSTFAAEDDNMLGISNERLRNGNIHLDDVPVALRSITDFLLSIAATIAVIMIIIGGYRILFGSFQNDRSKGRDAIVMALSGFALAALAWVIVKIIISNFS